MPDTDETIARSPHAAAGAAADPFSGGLCLFGGGFDTGNLGVSALTDSVIAGLLERLPRARVTVFDHQRGIRPGEIGIGGATARFEQCGARWSRRAYAFDTLWSLRVFTRLGGLVSGPARRIAGASSVLDISGGDSFTDLYGAWRYRQVVLPKLIALENRIPLVLLPQTYGPFAERRHRAVAERIVRGAAAAWARDEGSYDVLKELLGGDFDPERHRLGVDVAFLLPARAPDGPPGQMVAGLVASDGRPLVGFNVSGLLMNRPAESADQFGLRADYRKAVLASIERILANSDATVLLVPHVSTSPGHFESDPDACAAIAGALSPAWKARVAVLPPGAGQRETKWAISRCDWFCGTRMHSTIAALSTGVPVCAISYSMKTAGVFATCGLEGEVADPRRLDTGEVAEAVFASWNRRADAAARLRARLPGVMERARGQMDWIARSCASARRAR